MNFVNLITLMLTTTQLEHMNTSFFVKAFTTATQTTTVATIRQVNFDTCSNENTIPFHFDNKAISSILGIGIQRKTFNLSLSSSTSSTSSNDSNSKLFSGKKRKRNRRDNDENVETEQSKTGPYKSNNTSTEEENQQDTIRVRIWKALTLRLTSESGSDTEITLKELGAIVGQRQLGDLKDHLSHVEKQAKTLKNKSNEWKERRGFPADWDKRKINKLRLIIRKGKKNVVYVKLG